MAECIIAKANGYACAGPEGLPAGSVMACGVVVVCGCATERIAGCVEGGVTFLTPMRLEALSVIRACGTGGGGSTAEAVE